MQRNKEKSPINIQPNIHFVWIGTFKPISIEGPISLANATNEMGQSYPITYWVEEAQLAVATKSFLNQVNVRISSINDLINLYSEGDALKESRIHRLLEKCRIENLPTVAKEILAPIILSLNSGYFFDTSITAAKITNLPQLTQPALSRLFTTEKHKNLMDLQNEFNEELGDSSKKYITAKNSMDELGFPTSSDLFAFFSAVNTDGEITPDSKKLFSLLANKTIALWDAFFFNKQYLILFTHWPVNDLMVLMINSILLGSITNIYSPHEIEDNETILVIKNQNNKKQTCNLITPRHSTFSKCIFTTIDAFPVDEKPISLVQQKFQKLVGHSQPSLLELFSDGKQTGITKVCKASWKNNNFKAFIERQIKPYQETPLQVFLSNNRYPLFKSVSVVGVVGLAIAGGLAVSNFVSNKSSA